MLRRMKTFLAVCALAIVCVGCGAIQNADREVNKKTDHGASYGGGGSNADGGSSSPTGGDAGGSKDAGITSM